MKQTITRTITVTTVHYVIIEAVDGGAEVSKTFTVDLLGELDKAKAQKKMKPMFESAHYIVDLEHSTKVYEMEVEQFINYATIKEEK